MAKIIELAARQKTLDYGTEPCLNCKEQKDCCETCQKAVIWWHIFAKQFKGESHV